MQLNAIILNTFKETIRNRSLYNIVLFIFFLLLISFIVGNWSLGERVKIIKDFGMTAISIFGLLIALFIGIHLMQREREHKTIYIILSKPIKRWKIVLGKYLGLSYTIIVLIFLMTISFYFVLFLAGDFSWTLLIGILLRLEEILIIAALSLLFSTYFSPLLSAVFTILFYFVGHLSAVLKIYMEQDFSIIYKTVYYIVPNFERFSLSDLLFKQIDILLLNILTISLYAFFYILFILSVTILIFNRIEFE
jgi:ABC-type transport system involved in multi-copper enzyme maturation permease subunit